MGSIGDDIYPIGEGPESWHKLPIPAQATRKFGLFPFIASPDRPSPIDPPDGPASVEFTGFLRIEADSIGAHYTFRRGS